LLIFVADEAYDPEKGKYLLLLQNRWV